MLTLVFSTVGILTTGCVWLWMSLDQERRKSAGAFSALDSARKTATSYQELCKTLERQLQLAAIEDAAAKREVARLNEEVNRWQQEYSKMLHRVEELESPEA